ncbi:FHA domain-containing protein [Streptomyces sp. NRRL B-1677]|uniref:FHA domain-containing protein n=1 Tax=Streptomyces TaxID=1883 RepID=UPI001892B701|nr:FHA domain-containing protein [Streptomyces sp. NRRL B-1677]MBF6049364.1 FHA domain-containing protein [Streptomyces sp. NRRL B-1677]
MPTCPNGHQSTAEDWCEVCGHRMSGAPDRSVPSGAPGAGAVPPPPPAPPTGAPLPPPSGPQGAPGYGWPPAEGAPTGSAHTGDTTVQAELCPHCRTPREAQAPFCEECRYNFLTRTGASFGPPPPPAPQGLQSAPPPPPQHTQPPQSYEYYGSRPSRINRPAEPLTPETHPASPYADPAYAESPYADSPYADSPYAGSPAYADGPDGDWMLPPPSTPAPQSAPPYGYERGATGGVPGQQGGAQQQAPAGWTAVVAPDREYFTAMMNRSGPEASGLNLPAYSPELQLQLSGPQVTVGRKRHSTGESPDIDLSRPPEDPGVSHQHAMFVQQPDGSWAVVDQDSTNGTTINGSETPIQPYVPVPLQDGDRVHVGAWTTITLRRG